MHRVLTLESFVIVLLICNSPKIIITSTTNFLVAVHCTNDNFCSNLLRVKNSYSF